MSELPPLRAAVADDYRASSRGHRVALVGVAFWLAYEWGVGNETVTPWLLARVISDRDGLDGVVAAGVVGFTFTTLQQLLAGLTALAGFSMFDRTARAAWARLRARFGSVPGEWSTLGIGRRSVLVFGLGTTAVALVQLMTTGEVGVRRHRRSVTESALLCGTLVGLLGALVAALAAAGRSVGALEGATNWALRVLGNPLFWLGLIAVGLLVHLVRRDNRADVRTIEAGESPFAE